VYDADAGHSSRREPTMLRCIAWPHPCLRPGEDRRCRYALMPPPYRLAFASSPTASSPSGQAAVAADVAVLAAGDDVHGVLVGDVADAADGRGVDAGEAAGGEAVARAVAELDLDQAAVDEVDLFLLVVEVAAGLPAGRHDDRVDPERGDVELLADLAEPVALAHPVDVADGVAVAAHDVAHLVVSAHASSFDLRAAAATAAT
jgi:hypothetical protein